ncbi:YdcF family protein [Leptolyngbya sp. AN02str]|uniref:YdcF family protein n=1 Tax=Leptolyngbya sp. AN02str TaxID=3423363 RepID=UPI003D318DD3
MFEVLTRILLWLLIVAILWYVFNRFIPRVYLTWLGGLIVLAFVVLAFVDPTSRTVSSVWGILSLPLKPLGLVIFLLLSALKDGTKKIAANQVLAALLILLLSSMPIVAYWLTLQAEQSLTAPIAYQNAIAANQIRAIVVTGDGINPSDPSFRSRVQVSNTQDGFANVLASRLLYASRLYAEYAPVTNPFVVVGVGPSMGATNDEAMAEQTIRALLTEAGVPNDRILIEAEGTDLYSSAVAVSRLLEFQGFRRETDAIVLVTPSLSLSRSVSTFAYLGIRAIPQPTDQFAFQLEDGGRLLARVSDIIPNVDALALTTRVVDEYLTSVYYFLRGWLVAPI